MAAGPSESDDKSEMPPNLSGYILYVFTWLFDFYTFAKT